MRLRAVFYAVVLAVFLAMAAAYGLARWTPKRIAAVVDTQKLPAWRRYQIISCLVLAAASLALLCTEFYLRGVCAVRGGTVFWVQCAAAGVIVASGIAEALASRYFTGKQ